LDFAGELDADFFSVLKGRLNFFEKLGNGVHCMEKLMETDGGELGRGV